MIDLEKLNRAIANGWIEHPFEHLVVDGLLSPDKIKGLSLELPLQTSPVWGQNDHAHQVGKLYCEDIRGMTHGLREIASAFLNPQLAIALRQVTDDEPLLPDPYFSGAGLHAMRPGGQLSPHCDPDFHIPTGLKRAITIILYLNSAHTDDGGELILYDGRAPCKTIKPVAGRCVIFRHSKKSLHAVRRWNGTELRYTFGAFFYAPDETYKKLIFSPRWTVTADTSNHANVFTRTASQLAFAASRGFAYAHQRSKLLAYRLAAKSNSTKEE